ncbi:hypothetical protein PVK06_034784 [Gossypium arboreum]|uniref:CAAX prenyl protease 1 N-terminal domain-containing protein n=1 Tax=Gossypium arboreum TaxID=29729 RepID=A0ABR0NF47_GOSAR|nr:hypothetical protein PVK06_034784 [Gossypium arboreum]
MAEGNGGARKVVINVAGEGPKGSSPKDAEALSHFHFVHEFVTILIDSAILFFGILSWFWNKSGIFLPLLGLNEENEILHTPSFLAGVMIWPQITDLPFSLYSTFVIEARHGFNKVRILNR